MCIARGRMNDAIGPGVGTIVEPTVEIIAPMKQAPLTTLAA
jgi:hypothetical protein